MLDPSMSAVASCMCVRPILMMSFHSMDSVAMASRNSLAAEINRSFTLTAAAMFIAVGKESLEDMGHVDVIIGMNGNLTTNRCAGKLAAPVGNDFIHVHVELRSASSHPNMKRKHVRIFAGDDLVTSLNDESMLPVVEPADCAAKQGFAGPVLLTSGTLRSHGQPGFSINFLSRVQDLRREGGLWIIRIRDESTGATRDVQTKFLFIGAGGGSLALLQKSNIPERHGYAGFPVSGIWLRCDDTAISSRHDAKVYAKALLTWSVHLTRRSISFNTMARSSALMYKTHS